MVVLPLLLFRVGAVPRFATGTHKLVAAFSRERALDLVRNPEAEGNLSL